MTCLSFLLSPDGTIGWSFSKTPQLTCSKQLRRGWRGTPPEAQPHLGLVSSAEILASGRGIVWLLLLLCVHMCPPTTVSSSQATSEQTSCCSGKNQRPACTWSNPLTKPPHKQSRCLSQWWDTQSVCSWAKATQQLFQANHFYLKSIFLLALWLRALSPSV